MCVITRCATHLSPLTVGGDMNHPLTPQMAQMLQLDAQRAGERRAALLEARAAERPTAHINPRQPSFLRRLFRLPAEPAPARVD
jgi:hypothetical protein